MEQFETNFLVAACARPQPPGSAEFARISGISQTIACGAIFVFIAFDKHLPACYHDAGQNETNAGFTIDTDETER